MPTLIFVITAILYLAAAFVWYQEGWYRHFLVLVLGHFTALLDPLWQEIYGYAYTRPGAAVLTLFENPLPLYVVIGASWFYALPALLLFYSYRRRWWPRHYLTGVVAFMAMLLYHLLAQGLAKQSELWRFSPSGELPLALPYPLFVAALSALVSLLILYLLIATRHYAMPTIVPVLLGGLFAAPILVFGILGAPFWLPQIRALDQPQWVIGLGLVTTLGLVAWVVHLACWGLHASRHHRVRWS